MRSDRLFAVDPGTDRSAWVLFEDGRPVDYGTKDNPDMVRWLSLMDPDDKTVLVVEMIACYGQRVGREVFETCVQIGRMLQAHRWLSHRITRKEVTGLVCPGVAKPNDASVRAALIDRYGPGKAKAVGTKKAPGPLHGIKGDEWAALAVGVAWMERKAEK